jgi:hypothetical protein
MTGPSQAWGSAIQEENRGSPLENLHREMKALENAISHFQVQWE